MPQRISQTIALMLLLSQVSLAQPPAANGPPPPSDPRLDQLLQRWETDATSSQSLIAEIKSTRTNKAFNKSTEMTGYAKFLRLPTGDYAAKLELKSTLNPQEYERYICTGGFVYQFQPAEKAIYVYAMPPRQKGQLPDDGALPFLLGMKAETARRRYDMKITKENENYTYIDVYPKFGRDQVDFSYARLAILRKPYPKLPQGTPFEIFWVEPGGQEMKYNVLSLQRDAAGTVDRNEFTKPDLPQGWQWKNAQPAPGPAAPAAPPGPATKPPNVIRNQSGK